MEHQRRVDVVEHPGLHLDHKSVVAAVIVNGVEPIWVHPKFDPERHLAHPPEPDDVRRCLEEHPDAKGMLLITPTDRGSCADVGGVARVCHDFDVPVIVDEAWGVEQGHELLDGAIRRAHRIRAAVADLPGLRPMGREIVEEGLAADLDPLKMVIDVRKLGMSGMQAVEWLRTHRHVDVGGSDSCRISASITHADDDETEEVLLGALRALVEHADSVERRPPVRLPEPSALELEQAMLPREAFFDPVEHVPAERAAGRIAAETISPYPPGVPVVAPGEVITEEVLDYLRSGADHGVLIPDAADSSVRTLRVVAREANKRR
ncbi:hypothetical protein ACF09Y_27905 [Streptomyces massasporeus]|uniref:Orn/Lys/Arg family decarboxylase n=1 Tax=Streptomyces massasporeus TaxID=67324 RepID=UPI0036FA53AA